MRGSMQHALFLVMTAGQGERPVDGLRIRFQSFVSWCLALMGILLQLN